MIKRFFACIWKLIKEFCRWIWGVIKRHPIWTVGIVAVGLVLGVLMMYEIMHLSSTPAFCRVCHPREGSGPETEYYTWSQSVHSFNGVECLDCHTKQPGAWGYIMSKVGGSYDAVLEFVLSRERKLELLGEFEGNWEKSAELVSYEVCMHCHSDAVNQQNYEDHFMTFFGVAMRKIDSLKNPEFRVAHNMIDVLTDRVKSGVEPNHPVHRENNVPCAQCHVKVSHSGEFTGQMFMDTCFECHDVERENGKSPAANEDCMTCHVNQTQLQEGVIAEAFDITSDRWYMMDMMCEGCHYDPFETLTPQYCVDCHGDESYADMMIDWQSDFDRKQEVALAFLREIMPDRESLTPMKTEMFNTYQDLYNMVEKDRSKGVHNPEYVDTIFNEMDQIRRTFRATPSTPAVP